MIDKIIELKNNTSIEKVRNICESTIHSLNNTVYNSVSQEAKEEIQNRTIENLFESLSEFKTKEISDWVNSQKRMMAIKNLGIRETINELKKEEAQNNITLNKVLEQFRNKLEYKSEPRLYEEFITGLQSFKYFPKVDNALKAIEDRVSKYKTDIDLTNILDVMKETKSSYLIPFIERPLYNYIENKNEESKHQLKETLMKYTYDPYVRDIVNIVSLDSKDLHLEQANAECAISDIYSPVMYIGESEAIFNISGTYYAKKGNNINKVSKEDFYKLDNRFISLCETLNRPDIIVNKDNVDIYDGKNKASITENSVVVNGKEHTYEDMQKLTEKAKYTGNTEFYRLIDLISKNINEIAEIDFAKRVYLKENENYAADVFKLRDNIFITTYNPDLGKKTLYRNINPMQAKNLMKEHLNFDISSSLKGLMPNKEKIAKQINETKKSYNDYIQQLEHKINEFSNYSQLDDTSKDVVDALNEELDEIKGEFKDYLNKLDGYNRVSKGEELNEQLSLTISVGDQDYIVPLPAEAMDNLMGGSDTNTGDEEDVSDVEATQDGEGEYGTEVGAEHKPEEPASAVTFDDEDNMQTDDNIDLGDDETADYEEDEEEAGGLDTGEEEGEEGEEGEEEEEEEEEEGNESNDKDNKPHKKVYLKTKKKTNESRKTNKTNKRNKLFEGEPIARDEDREDVSEPWERDSEYEDFFIETIRKYGYRPNELDEMPEDLKKEMFNEIDRKWEAKNESIKESHADSRQQKIDFLVSATNYTESTLRKMSYNEIQNLYYDTEDIIVDKLSSLYKRELTKPNMRAHDEPDIELLATKAADELGITYDTVIDVAREYRSEIDPNNLSESRRKKKLNKKNLNESKDIPKHKKIKYIRENTNDVFYFADLMKLSDLELNEMYKRTKNKNKKPEKQQFDTKVFKVNNKNQKLNESFTGEKYKLPKKLLKENKELQLGDEVKIKGQRGSIISVHGDNYIVQLQGSTKTVKPSEVKIISQKPNVSTRPQHKFDEKTQKVLFEQMVKCGIYMNNVPVKTNNCYIKYSDYQNAKDNDDLNVLIEGNNSFLQKNKIRIFEDVNDFANPDDYVNGVLLNGEGEAVENVLIHAEDYTKALGNADEVRVIRGANSENPNLEYVAKANLKTLSI